MIAWGRWGAGDERGAANLIDAAAVQRGVGAVRTGEVLSLAMPMQPGSGSAVVGRPPLQHFMLRDGGDYADGRPERGGFGFADDCVLLATHGSTHIDALSHVWQDGLMYNGFPASTVGSSGARVCGIDKAGPLITRGIFIDLVPPGRPTLEASETIGSERLAEVLDMNGVQPQPGDALIVRTGWTEAWLRGQASQRKWPGLDRQCAEWIAEHDFALVAADNVGVEAFPSSERGCQVPLHVALLRGRGIYFCELLKLDALAAQNRADFLFIVSPLPLIGGVGSPVNPVAVL
jgi:kynurenine formamidase